MIEELIEARAGSLKLTDWDTPGGRAGGGAAAAESSGGGSGADGGGAAAGGDPCQFTADVRKAVTAMHNILQQQLTPEQLQVGTYVECVLSVKLRAHEMILYLISWSKYPYGRGSPNG